MDNTLYTTSAPQNDGLYNHTHHGHTAPPPIYSTLAEEGAPADYSTIVDKEAPAGEYSEMIVAITHTTSRHTTSTTTTTGMAIAAPLIALVVIVTVGVVEDCNVVVVTGYLVVMVLWLVTFGVRTTVVGIKFSLCALTTYLNNGGTVIIPPHLCHHHDH